MDEYMYNTKVGFTATMIDHNYTYTGAQNIRYRFKLLADQE